MVTYKRCSFARGSKLCQGNMVVHGGKTVCKYWLIKKVNLTVLHNQCETIIYVSMGAFPWDDPDQDHSDHGMSNEPMNPLLTRIHRFIWSTMIWVISHHWSWSGSSQRNAHYVTWLTHLFFVVCAAEREIEHDKENGAILSKGHTNDQ